MSFLGSNGDLVTFWKSRAAITALVGSGSAARIYPDRAKQGVDPPYLVYEIGSGSGPFKHHKGSGPLRESVVHVYCYGTDSDQAGELAEAVLAATEPLQETTVGETFVAVVVAATPDWGDEPPDDGSDSPAKEWRRLVFQIVHTEQ